MKNENSFVYQGDIINEDLDFIIPEWAVEMYKSGLIFEENNKLYIYAKCGYIEANKGDTIKRVVKVEVMKKNEAENI